MPPISGKREGRRWRAGEVGVDLAGDVALQAAQDVEFGEAVFGPPLDRGPGRWVAVHADQGDAPQGVVGPPVTGPVEPVAVGAARGRGDGCGTAQVGEGGLGAQPLGVVAGGNQQLAGGVDPDPGRASRVGATAATRVCSWPSRWSSSAWSCCQRRARARRVVLVAAVGLVRGPGRIPAQIPTSALVLRPSRVGGAPRGRCRARRGGARRPPPGL
jgi:hypothetical protein